MPNSEWMLFAKAAVVGLSIAAPVGPVGLLTIQRTLRGGLASGLATGMGAAVADALYGAVGAFGVVWLIQWLTAAQVPLGIGGGALLLWLAWRSWHAPMTTGEAAAGGGSLWGQFAGTWLLTLSNPATILSFVAIFGALSGSMKESGSPLVMVGGVLCGSALWWMGLTCVISVTRQRFTPAWRRRVNRASAVFLAAFALWQWVAVLRSAQ
ncbi:MAG: LysE family transporter [Burkholderiaceae bacterium]